MQPLPVGLVTKHARAISPVHLTCQHAFMPCKDVSTSAVQGAVKQIVGSTLSDIDDEGR